MKKAFVFLALVSVIASCNRETDDFIWEKSYGKGSAHFIKSASDSGVVSCGMINNSPYLLKLDRDRKTEFEYSSPYKGSFSSVWFADGSRYVAGGASEGKMLLSCIGEKGNLIWDTLITASFKIRTTGIVNSGSGSLTAVGTAKPDSVESGTSGILFVRFNTAGVISEKKEAAESDFVAAGRITTDGSGNILIPLTRKRLYTEPQSSIAKYSGELNRLWETELYNNASFGASGSSALADEAGNIFVTGRTELSSADSVLNNSFLAAISSSGTILWKKYLEKTNSGASVIFDTDGLVMALNTNCFIVSKAEPEDGADAGTIKMFQVCNSKTTDAFGKDLDLYYDGNIIVAGSKGENYYLALESYLQ